MEIKHLSGNPWPLKAESRPAEGAAAAPTGKIRAACAEMESLFIYHLFKEMRATSPKSGFMGGGAAENLYTDMLHQQLSRELAVGGGIGLSDILMAQLAQGLGGAPDDTAEGAPEEKFPEILE